MQVSKLSTTILVGLLLSGCAAQQTFKEGQQLLEAGYLEEGLGKIHQAYQMEPTHAEYRARYFNQRDMVVYRWLLQAEQLKNQGEWQEAEHYYQRVLKLDADNFRAKTGLSTLPIEQKRAAQLAEAQQLLQDGQLEPASHRVREVLREAPSHPAAQVLLQQIEAKQEYNNQAHVVIKSRLSGPITIEFKDASLAVVLNAIARSSDLNFMLDKDVKQDVRVSLMVRDAKIEDVLQFVLQTNQLDRRVLNQNTLYIYPDLPHKKREFQELQVKNLFLTNAPAKDVSVMLKSILKLKDVHVDERLNLLVIRDTPETIKVAERLVNAQDMADPEVMLDVEVLEVNTNVLDRIGIQYPSQLSLSVIGSNNVPGTLPLDELRSLSSRSLRATISDPGLLVSLLHENGNSRILANPKIRAKNREKAKVMIGEKLPVISNTTTSTGLVSQSVSYLDVGLKLDVEPTVYLNNDVGIKVGLEVSSVSKQIQNSKDGSLTYQIGTRNASTALRLKDGETQILAGLINKEDRKALSGIPGLSELPIVGRLFSTHTDTTSNSEIVLLITPRVIRNIVRPESPLETFLSGTEAEASLNRLELNPVVPSGTVELVDKSIAYQNKPLVGSEVVDKSLPLVITPPPNKSDSGSLLRIDAPRTIAVETTFNAQLEFATGGAQQSELVVRYDPSKLQLLNIQAGDLLKNNSDNKLQQQISEQDGEIKLTLQRTVATPETGRLVSLLFQTLEAGNTILELGQATLTDDAGKPLTFVPPSPVTIEIRPQ